MFGGVVLAVVEELAGGINAVLGSTLTFSALPEFAGFADPAVVVCPEVTGAVVADFGALVFFAAGTSLELIDGTLPVLGTPGARVCAAGVPTYANGQRLTSFTQSSAGVVTTPLAEELAAARSAVCGRTLRAPRIIAAATKTNPPSIAVCFISEKTDRPAECNHSR